MKLILNILAILARCFLFSNFSTF